MLARPASVRPMEGDLAAPGMRLTHAQRRVVEHGPGAMLVVGAAGSGRSEALAARLARLSVTGTAPEQVMVLTRSRAAAAGLRARTAALIELPYEELWISTFEVLAERLLREHALEAGLDPFFATVRAADRLAMLLDRLDELSLRRHEIRGNPAGLLARLLRRIDALKAERITPGRLRDWAEEREREAQGAAERERAQREREFADLYASHDRVLRDCGSLDGGDLVIELERLLGERADVRRGAGGALPVRDGRRARGRGSGSSRPGRGAGGRTRQPGLRLRPGPVDSTPPAGGPRPRPLVHGRPPRCRAGRPRSAASLRPLDRSRRRGGRRAGSR